MGARKKMEARKKNGGEKKMEAKKKMTAKKKWRRNKINRVDCIIVLFTWFHHWLLDSGMRALIAHATAMAARAAMDVRELQRCPRRA